VQSPLDSNLAAALDTPYMLCPAQVEILP